MKHPWSPQQFAAEARKAGRSQGVIDASRIAAATIKRLDAELPVIFSLSHFAHLAGISPATIVGYAVRSQNPPPYRVFQLKKRPKPASRAPSRGYRTICVPEPNLMRAQRWIAQNILSTTAAAPHPASFAYYADRGLLKAAERHAGCTWLVKMDVRDFFDSISERRVYRVFRSLGYSALLSFQLARICTRVRNGDPDRAPGPYGVSGYYHPTEGRLPQGAPTSPGLANLAVKTLDTRLHALADRHGWTYTRYADDLAFSTLLPSNRDEARRIVTMVKHELRAFGLDPNDAKTIIAPPGSRRLVLGLLVDGAAPRLQRDFKTNLETHLYALTADHIGPDRHRQARGFASVIGMRRHVSGLVAFAHYVEPNYARRCYEQLNAVAWPA